MASSRFVPPSGVMPPTLVQRGRRLVAGDAVGPEPGSAGEGDHAHGVLRLQLRGQHAQRLADDGHAVGALHGAGNVEQQHEVQRAALLPAGGGGLDGEAQEFAIVRKRIARPLGRQTPSAGRRRLPGRDNQRR